MEVNPVTPPSSPVPGQSSTVVRRPSGDAAPTPDFGPALRLESSRGANVKASGVQMIEAESNSPDADDLKKAETLRALISNENMQLRTYHDDASGRSVLEVSDQATGEIVSQYPSDELLRLYAALREPLVDQSA